MNSVLEPFPSVKNIPLASHVVVRADSLTQIESAIKNNVEARRLSYLSAPIEQGVTVTRFELAQLQLFGLEFKSPLSIESEELQSANVIMPLSGQMTPDSSPASAGCIARGSARVHSPGERISIRWESSSISLVLRIPDTILNRYRSDLQGGETNGVTRLRPTLDLLSNDCSLILGTLSTVLNEVNNERSLIHQNKLAQYFQDILVSSLLSFECNSLSGSAEQRNVSPRPYYVRRAVEYMHENADQLISICDVVNASGASLRSLQAGFSSYYEMGPSAYLKNLKLNCAHRELKRETPASSSVSKIAAHWGFFNLGSFSRSYKKQYGLSPSETLNQS